MTTLIEPRTTRIAPAASATISAPARSRRDPSIDLARAWCLVVVVALHALMVGVSLVDGAPVLENALEAWSGFAAFTWVAQIMPLFFVLGGFSSATQWGRLRAEGVPAHRYVLMRVRRLLAPAVTAMAAIAVLLLGLLAVGVPDDVVAIAGFRMSQPLWFLGVYLLCTALVPLMTAAHRAAPRATLAGLAALVVGVDVARMSTGAVAIGFANLLFVWLLVQQLGFRLADDRARASRRRLLAIAAGALVALAALCASGLYSPDLLENLNPPTAALVLLGIAQLCLFELARPALRRAHGIRAIRAATTAINARAMTIYSWHMPVLIVLAGALLLGVGEALPTPLSPEWWATRAAWLAAVAVAVTAVVAVAGRREAGARMPSVATRALVPARLAAPVALSAAAAGVLVVLLAGSSPLAWIAGAALLASALALATNTAGAPGR